MKMNMGHWWNAKKRDKSKCPKKKPCPISTLSTTNHTGIILQWNPGLRGDKPVTNGLSHGTNFKD
jgi:hypothetical protein